MKFIPVMVMISFFFSCSTVPQPEIQYKEKEKTIQTVSLPEEEPPPVTESEPPAEKEHIEPLSDSEIELQIHSTVPASFAPVIEENDHIRIVFHDLDNNGYKDAFFLVIKKQDGIESNIESLSDVSKLADKKDISIDYFLSVYLQSKGRMISMYRIPIGSRKILNGFGPLYIKKGSSKPFGLNISFLTEKGVEEEWILFSSYNRFSFFTIFNNTSVSYEINDIDNDGYKDIIEWKHGLEEGTGYETYLTWYRWNGREYREKSSTNVVRNLNNFLERSAHQILQKQWSSFIQTNLLTKDRNTLKESRRISQTVFNRIFVPLPSKNEDQQKVPVCTGFRSVIFPKIFENPFKIQGTERREVDFMVRFECEDGSEFIRSVRIALNRNPFGKYQYFFILN